MKIRNHARREEHGFAARELGVVDLAAPDELVLQLPGQRGFRIFLHVARQYGIAAPADGHVERRPGPPRISESGGKAGVLDETLRVVDGLDLPRRFAAPALVAVLFNFVWNLELVRSHLSFFASFPLRPRRFLPARCAS